MSRGHGETQRKILASLASHPRQHAAERWDRNRDETRSWPGWITVHELTCAVYGTDQPARGQVETVRRAARRLAAEGLAEIGETWDAMPRRQLWNGRPATGRQFGIRPVLTPAEKAAKEAFYAPPARDDAGLQANFAKLQAILGRAGI